MSVLMSVPTVYAGFDDRARLTLKAPSCDEKFTRELCGYVYLQEYQPPSLSHALVPDSDRLGLLTIVPPWSGILIFLLRGLHVQLWFSYTV